MDLEANTVSVSCRGVLPVSVRGLIHGALSVLVEKEYGGLKTVTYVVCGEGHKTKVKEKVWGLLCVDVVVAVLPWSDECPHLDRC